VSSLAAQASLLDLYDPDRATAHTEGGAALDDAAVKDLLAGIGKAHAGDGGAGLAFLAEESSSPTRSRLVPSCKTPLSRRPSGPNTSPWRTSPLCRPPRRCSAAM
jgi:hypothetical protein